MSSSRFYLENHHFSPSSKTAGLAESDNEDCKRVTDYRRWLANRVRQLIAYGLALLLLLLGLFLVLLGQDGSRSSMAHQWPKVALVKAQLQRRLRSLLRDASSRQALN